MRVCGCIAHSLPRVSSSLPLRVVCQQELVRNADGGFHPTSEPESLV